MEEESNSAYEENPFLLDEEQPPESPSLISIIIIAIMINVFGRKKLSRPEPVPSPLANMRTGGQ